MPIWQTQYYLIEHINPLSLFGCILYLENLSLKHEVGPQVYRRCLPVYGNKATSYLRVHVEEDTSHVKKLFDMIDQLPGSSRDDVKVSLQITSSLYKNFFIELSERHSSSLAKSA